MFRKLTERLRAPKPIDPVPVPAATGAGPSILDSYVHQAPSAQLAVEVFKGEWWSVVPGVHTGGLTPLFDDARVKWAVEQLGGVAGRKVLELGPLEGGHTYMLEQAGAASVVAIEANTRAYLKCLIAKEVVGMQRARFQLGDFEEYLRGGAERQDVVFACGVLYHMRNPVELLQNIARVTDRVYVWTHYMIPERVAAIPHMAKRFSEPHQAEQGGFKHTLHRYNYGDFLDTTRFSGGSEVYSHWLGRDDLIAALRHAGLSDIVIGDDEVAHVNGPCISLVARRPT